MDRKQFLKGSGLALISSLVKPSAQIPKADCVLIPRETAGPFPLDLSENEFFLRQDVREDELGTPLRLRLQIIGIDNCEPMPNVRVHIWHCDRLGVYSGYNTGSNPGDVNGTQLRGYQFADANGEVEFLTAFPGWYPGRLCHIHFQVFVSTNYSAVSQLTFPLDMRDRIYADQPDVYTKGADPLTFSTDNLFADGHELQLATLIYNADTEEYDSFLQVAVEGSGTTGIGHLERQIQGIFELGQNAPNPYQEDTSIPVRLKQASHLNLSLWSLNGQRVATLVDAHYPAGQHQWTVAPKALGLPATNYIYQLEAANEKGIFRMPKMMTVG